MHEHRSDRRDTHAALSCGLAAICLSLAVGCGPEVIQKSHADTKQNKAAAGRGAPASKANTTKKSSDDADAGPDVNTGSQSRKTESAGSGGAGGTGKPAQALTAGSAASSSAAQAGAGGAANTAPTEALTWSAPALIENETPDAASPVYARNRAGDVVVGWWQDTPSGFIWMRRFINGAWDATPFRVKGETNPGTFNWTQFVGIDRLGAADFMFLGNVNSSSTGKRVYWTKWQGEDSVPLETKPLVLGDQALGLPINLAVSDTGLSFAHWLALPPDDMTPTQVMYTNTRDESGWDTPTEHETIPAQTDARYFSTATNGDGDFITAIRYKSSEPEKHLRSVHTYLQRDGVLTAAPPIETPAPVGLVDMELDTGGNATTTMLVGTSAQEMKLYATRYSASSKTWTTPEQLSQGVTKIEDLTLLPGAVPFVAWIDAKEITETTTVGKIFTSRLDAATGKWAAPEAISDEVKMRNGFLWTAANSAGSIVVVWAAVDASDATALYYERYTRADGWSKPGIITPYTGEISVFGLVLAEDGRALVMWQHTEPGSRINDLKWSRSR